MDRWTNRWKDAKQNETSWVRAQNHIAMISFDSNLNKAVRAILQSRLHLQIHASMKWWILDKPILVCNPPTEYTDECGSFKRTVTLKLWFFCLVHEHNIPLNYHIRQVNHLHFSFDFKKVYCQKLPHFKFLKGRGYF